MDYKFSCCNSIEMTVLSGCRYVTYKNSPGSTCELDVIIIQKVQCIHALKYLRIKNFKGTGSINAT